jgi:hypothetical protein
MNLCSLWDWNYNPRGMALLESLRRYEPKSKIHVLALDRKTYDWLFPMTGKYNMIPYLLDSIETDAMKEARSNRTLIEYYWTLASVWTNTVLNNTRGLHELAYIDSDCYLFNPLAVLLDEFKNSQIAIAPMDSRLYRTTERKWHLQRRVCLFQENRQSERVPS